MSMAHRQVRLSYEELHELKQLMGALLVMLSFWSLASLDIGSVAILLLGGLVAAVAFFFPRWVARIPSVVWRWAGPVILLVIVGDFTIHVPEFIPPLVRMVVLLIIYRMLAPRNQREDLQVILLCLFCVVISGVLSVSILFAFQIFLFAPLAMALLFVICLLDRGKEINPYVINWEQFNWLRMIRRVWRVIDFRVMVLCAFMFALVVAVSSLLFVLTPRFDFNQRIPFLEISTQARSGFSEEVQLGEVSEILEDRSVALRIDVPSMEALRATPYWRMLVLDEYENGRFRMSSSLKGKPLREFRDLRELRSPDLPMSARSGALWTFYMEGGISRYLPVSGDFAALRFQKKQDLEFIPSVHVIAIGSVRQNVLSYQFEDLKFNRRFAAGVQERALLEPLPLEVVTEESPEYPLTMLELNLSAESVAILQEINQEVLAGAERGAAAYSQAVTDYLWQHFKYSLNPDAGQLGRADPIAGWLESGTRGHCELFAGAFTLLAREAGFPARMVVGYTGGSWNTLEDYFVVRNSDAHAWVEIYDSEDHTWLRVDPTPGGRPSDPEAVAQRSMVFESGWSAWVDSLRIQWYRRIVNFEQKDQVELAMIVKGVLLDYYAAFKEKLRNWSTAMKTWVTRPLDIGILRPLAVIFVLGLGVFFLWRVRYQCLDLLFKISRRSEALNPVRRQAGRYLQRLKTRGIDSELVDELQAIRFGPVLSSSCVRQTFTRVRRLLKTEK